MSRPVRVQFAGEIPATRRDSTFIDKRKEVLVAKSVVEEVRKRVMQFRGLESRVEREKEKEKEKEKEEKMEKARAAAWAWYQHGKGGKESVSSSGGVAGGASTLSIRPGGPLGDPGPKSSRFKTEALKTPGPPVITRGDSDRIWEISTISLGRPSSLFDSYELDSVSKRIDNAFHGESSSAPTPINLPPPMRPPGAYFPKEDTVLSPKMTTIASPKVSTISAATRTTSIPKVTRSSSLRMQFPRSLCRSISDVVSREEMALGVDIGKCDCHKTKIGRTESGGWSLRRISRAIQVLIHLPESEYHPQQQHHERRHARLHHHEHHHHHHQHDHEHHHHIHYQVKLRDGVHHGNSFTTYPRKSDSFAEAPKEKDHLSFPRLSPRMSPKVSPKLV